MYMACTKCDKQKSVQLRVASESPYPFMASDIQVVDHGEARPFEEADWPVDKHVLLVVIPEAFTPVCETELGALNQWCDAFHELGCELIAVCTDPPAALIDWYASEPALAEPRYKVFSSYLLPSRLGIVSNGRAKRASVFVTQDGEIVKQEHFSKVGRSFAELHRMLYGYTTNSYCAEGWQSPEDGFLEEPA